MKKEKNENIILFICLTLIFLFSLIGLSNFATGYLVKQTLWLYLGLILLLIMEKLNIKIVIKYSFLIYVLNLLLLILVLLIGRKINGAKAWFSFGPFSFQPSELMKISLSLVYFKIIKTKKKDFWLLIEIMMLFIFPSILVFLEPDTGSIIIYFIIILVALFNSNIKKSYLIISIVLGIILILSLGIIYVFNGDLLIKILGTSIFYRLDRIIHFKNNYQLSQALIYIGSASLFGHKELLYIPEAHTDFIFAFLLGKYGIILGIIILINYFIINLIIINKTKKNLFIKFFLSTFLFNQIYNIFMNIGLLPIMGIPLPFLSYGGTNTIINLLFLGICLNNTINKKC